MIQPSEKAIAFLVKYSDLHFNTVSHWKAWIDDLLDPSPNPYDRPYYSESDLVILMLRAMANHIVIVSPELSISHTGAATVRFVPPNSMYELGVTAGGSDSFIACHKAIEMAARLASIDGEVSREKLIEISEDVESEFISENIR